MFFKALLVQIDPAFDDPRFGSYKTHDKGGCDGGKVGDGEHDGDQKGGGGCLREYWNRAPASRSRSTRLSTKRRPPCKS